AKAAGTRQPLRLDDLQIREPEKEKSILEKKGSLAWIIYLSGDRPSFFLPDGERLRISEIYRLCYEKQFSLAVITDFVAHFPAITFQSPWLAALVRQRSQLPPGRMR